MVRDHDIKVVVVVEIGSINVRWFVSGRNRERWLPTDTSEVTAEKRQCAVARIGYNYVRMLVAIEVSDGDGPWLLANIVCDGIGLGRSIRLRACCTSQRKQGYGMKQCPLNH